MSLPKAQLVDPQGNMNLPGMTATGIVTATSLSGIATGSATGLTGNPDLDVGIVTASSFVGQGDGHAANLTGTPELNLGITTSTGFVGDATGKAAGLTGTPNLNVGLITATSFVGFVTGGVTGNITGDVTGNITGNISGNVEGNVTGDVSGLARGLGINGINVWTGAGTSNLGVGVCTAVELHGDGSTLTGAGSTAYIAQEITATGLETIIDLSYGNLIYFDQATAASTTVGFASTSAAEQITFIRNTAPYSTSWNISYATGGVTFDGTDDALTIAADSDFDFGTGAYTIEFWVKTSTSNAGWTFFNSDSTGNWYGMRMAILSGVVEFNEQVNDQDDVVEGTTNVTDNAWHHVAICRGASGDKTKLYIDGKLDATGSANRNFDNDNPVHIGKRNTGYSGYEFNGILSNYRVNKGNAVYTSDFVPPTSALTNISGTVFLALQSTTDDTAYTVSPGTITASSSPTAGAQTITNTGSLLVSNYSITWPDSVKWNDGTTPTLYSSTQSNAGQIFHLTTVDTGAIYRGWEQIKVGDSSSLFSWGRNNEGQLGLNNVAKYSSPTQVGSGVGWARLLNKGASASMYDISGAIKTDGTLWVWGDNVEGELGLNDRTDRSSPTQIPGSWSTGTTGGHGQGDMMCIKTDGTLWGWGTVQVGNLGLNTPHDTMNSSPAQIGTDTNWSKVRMGKETAVGSKTDGTLWVWGANDNGVLGLNAPGTGNRSSPTQIPGTWSDSFDVGDAVSMTAVKADGTLWSWGSQSDGQLGQNEASTPSKRAYSSPVQVGTDTTWGGAKIAHGSQSFGYVKTDGTLWMIGRNNYGKLGLNSGTDSRSSPTQVPGTTWASISGSYTHYMGSKTDNTMWVWGENSDGCFGLNNQGGDSQSSPIQIPGTNWDAQEQDKLAVDMHVSQALKGS